MDFLTARTLLDEAERAYDALARDTDAPDATLATLAAAYKSCLPREARNALAQIVQIQYPSLGTYLSDREGTDTRAALKRVMEEGS